MSSAKARRQASSTIACPPNFTTTTLPWNSLSHGSAPVRTATFWASPSGSLCRMTRRVPTFLGSRRCGAGSSMRTSGGVGSCFMWNRPSSRGRRRWTGRWSRSSPVRRPAFRSTSIVIARPVRSTPSRGSPIAPPRQTVTPLIVTSTWSASNAASVVPIAASTRPQLGSLPNSAVLSRLLRAHARPAVSASSTLAALRTVIAMSLVDPSASASSCIARSVAAAVSASVNSSADGVTPLAPLASTITVSLVERQPSESTRSKDRLVAVFSAACSVCGSTTASVVRTTSIVARLGASMPAPLAMPPTVQPVALLHGGLRHAVGGHDRPGRVRSAVLAQRP